MIKTIMIRFEIKAILYLLIFFSFFGLSVYGADHNIDHSRLNNQIPSAQPEQMQGGNFMGDTYQLRSFGSGEEDDFPDDGGITDPGNGFNDVPVSDGYILFIFLVIPYILFKNNVKRRKVEI